MTEARKPQFGRTREEKLRIAAECRKYDIVETCKKHGIYTASYYDRVQCNTALFSDHRLSLITKTNNDEKGEAKEVFSQVQGQCGH